MHMWTGTCAHTTPAPCPLCKRVVIRHGLHDALYGEYARSQPFLTHVRFARQNCIGGVVSWCLAQGNTTPRTHAAIVPGNLRVRPRRLRASLPMRPVCCRGRGRAGETWQAEH